MNDNIKQKAENIEIYDLGQKIADLFEIYGLSFPQAYGILVARLVIDLGYRKQSDTARTMDRYKLIKLLEAFRYMVPVWNVDHLSRQVISDYKEEALPFHLRESELADYLIANGIGDSIAYTEDL